MSYSHNLLCIHSNLAFLLNLSQNLQRFRKKQKAKKKREINPAF